MRTVAALGLIATVACHCGGEIGSSESIAVLDPASKAGLDFGRVRVGETRRLAITIRNDGLAALTIDAVQREGLPPSIHSTLPPGEIRAGQDVQLEVTFSPEDVGQVGGTLVFLTNAASTPRLEVSLVGEGIRTDVVVTPGALDFGLREVLTREVRSITVRNEGLVAEQVTLVPFPDRSPHFELGPLPGEGEVLRLEAGAAAEVPVVFAPKSAGETLSSTVGFLVCETCAPVVVAVRGSAVDAFLEIEPKGCLDFGLVRPGASLERRVRLTNGGTRGVQLLDAALVAGGERFTLGHHAKEIDPGQVVELPVTYGPDARTSDEGSLRVRTDDPKAQELTICLRGAGGGPDLFATPAALDFGRVAVGLPRTRTVRLSNAALGSDAGVLRVTGLSFAGSDVAFSSVTATPFEIPAGGSRNVEVTYTPNDEGMDTERLVVATNDTEAPVLEVALTGRGLSLPPCRIEVVPGALAFGNVERGQTATLPFALRNEGDADCLVDSLDLTATTDPAFSLPDGAIGEHLLPAGETLSIPVSFLPDSVGEYGGQVAFNVSDPERPQRTVTLTGLSAPGCLLIAPSEIDFGTVGANCASREREIAVYNTCTTTRRITSLSLNADPGAPFVLLGGPTGFPLVVDPANGVRFRAKYSPKELGQHAGGIFIGSDERPEPHHLPMVGRATGDAVQQDRFVQEARPSVDLLFVVDNSESMSPYQQRLATNFEAFIRYANEQQIDYRIAVTTTDVQTNTGEGRGYFVPRSGLIRGRTVPRVLTPRTPNVETEFATIVNVGTSGSANEAGLEAAYLAFTAPASTTPISAGGNAGFLRDDAMLSIIVVSDEEDSSWRDVGFYLDSLRHIKGAGRPSRFSLSAIVDPGSGGRYVAAAEQTNGVVGSIKTGNWAADLERLGANAFGNKSRFVLTSTPASGSMEVRIDGRLVPARESNGTITHWQYDADANAVEFDARSIPPPGSTLEVSYLVGCGA